jgi:molecular chaperone GrpE
MTKDKSKQAEQQSESTVHVEQTVTASVTTDGARDDRAQELEDDLKRVQAEFLNYKRRVEGERAEYLAMGRTDAVMTLLPLLDNIGRALAHMPPDLEGNAWAGGVVAVGKQADATLASLGVERIEATGQPFDPVLHEAVAMEEGEGETEVVTEELQPGYRMGDRVLQHAMVKVGRK